MTTLPSSPAAVPVPSPVEERPTIREHHGDHFVDPYEWLRDGEDPAVIAHLEAENAYAETVTASLEPLRQRIFGEIKSRVLETDLSVPVARGPWWYYTRTVEGQQYAVHARSPLTDRSARPELGGDTIPGEQVLVDGNVEADDSEFFSIGALSISHDHQRLALATDRLGDERFDLVIKDLTTGEVLDDGVRRIGYGVEFSLDAAHVFYTRLDDAWRPYQLWRHRVGSDPGEDILVHQEDDERFWMGVGGSRDERWLIHTLGSRTTSEVRLLDSSDPTGEWHVVAPRQEGVEYDVEPAGDRLFIIHNRDSIESDLAWALATSTSMDQWQPLLASSPGERFLGTEAFDSHLVLGLRRNGLTALRLIPLSDNGFGDPVDLEFDEELLAVDLGDNPEPDQASLQLSYESFLTPRTVLDYDLRTGERTILKQQPVLGGYDPSDYVQQRAWASAPDGAQIPVSIIHRAGLRPDGTAAGLLTAYGSYEISSDPSFSVARLSLLDRGVVFAVAHVRGGGEMGRHWYEDGKLLRKPHTFTDTVAVARLLHDEGWVAPDRLALEGGSAGGLLVGAVINLAPELFRVVHAAVPFVDALTTILRPDLPLTVGEWEEWGNPLEDPEVYACMKSYTPYENVTPRAYPAVLATTSLHDTRVFFTEAAKWVARLRATVANDPATHPILLRTQMAAGHGGRSGRYAGWEQTAWEWAFVVDQLGAGSSVPD